MKEKASKKFKVDESRCHGQFSDKGIAKDDHKYVQKNSIVTDVKSMRKRIIDNLDYNYGY